MSTSDKNSATDFISAGWWLALMATCSMGLLVYFSGWLLEDSYPAFRAFFRYFPLLLVVSLPYHFNIWASHGLHKFNRMNVLRLGLNALFLGWVFIGYQLTWTFPTIMMGYLGSHALLSILSLLQFRWARLPLLEFDWVKINLLWQFGKNSVLTLSGASLLKSADHLLIGALLGPQAVAVYSIPAKLVDLVEIPLRAFVVTSFPRLSKLHQQGQRTTFVQSFYHFSGGLTLLLVPILLIMLFFPGEILQMLGGSAYKSKEILMPFLLVMLLLPLDKISGVALDSVRRPDLNARKVWLMVILNLLGDLIILHFFHWTAGVVWISVLNMLLGLLMVFKFHPFLSFSPADFFSYGWKSVIHRRLTPA
jgi:O-antigen/teichoic acid export membrane protein